ncbi:hypothetical protein GGR57DRAFT_509343 [Xylariaceae sp. FL1272]|nr:hypothetical protein GGR57DRAFT_509343 [Xylariaceae sp. FL1272]
MVPSYDPSEADIAQLQELLDLSRNQAVSCLRANGNDVERAVDDYFANPDPSKYQYDESAWNSDREGHGHAAGNNFAFNIQGPDEHPPPLSFINSAAPTRPPSRTNNPSPLGKLVDLTADEATTGAPTTFAQEDADLQRALAASAAESGIQPQETGFVDRDTDAKHFGPANRHQYDIDQWAMVPTGPTANPKYSVPASSTRRREAGVPVILRQSKDHHHLAPLMSIYNQIPLAKNALLVCGRSARDYGHNPDWWRGIPILSQTTHPGAWGDDVQTDLFEELHRLMAFLDKSDRSYGNADMLADARADIEGLSSWDYDADLRFFKAIKGWAKRHPGSGMESMTTTGSLASLSPNEDEDSEDHDFSILVIDFNNDGNYDDVSTLYDALDHMMWDVALLSDLARFAVLSRPADVFTIRFAGGGLRKACDIPAVFYLDRYMDERKHLAMHFRRQMHFIRTKLRDLEAAATTRLRCRGEHGCAALKDIAADHSTLDCAQKMIDLAQELITRRSRDGQWRQRQEQWAGGGAYSIDDLRLIHTWAGPFELREEELTELRSLQRLIEDLEEEKRQVTLYTTTYEQEKERLDGYLDVVRKRLTCQEHEANDELFVFRADKVAYHAEYWNPCRRYLLRGVVLSKELSYVCVRSGSAQDEASDQWWKMDCSEGDATPAVPEKTTLDDVLIMAGTRAKTPILVYASEEALQAEPTILPDALRMFIKADNRAFQQELVQEQSSGADLAGSKHDEPGAPNVSAVPVAGLSHGQNQQPAAVTAANLAQMTETTHKRKHTSNSSIATRGSLRSDLGDVELQFDDAPEAMVTDSDGQYVEASPPSKLGGIVESFAKCQTQEPSAPVAPEPSKVPEMREREGGRLPPIFAQGNTTQQRPIDSMDLDTEQEAMND